MIESVLDPKEKGFRYNQFEKKIPIFWMLRLAFQYFCVLIVRIYTSAEMSRGLRHEEGPHGDVYTAPPNLEP